MISLPWTDWFLSSFVIHSCLGFLTLFSWALLIYLGFNIYRSFTSSEEFEEKVQDLLRENKSTQALKLCQGKNSVVSQVLACALAVSHQDPALVLQTISAETKRLTLPLSERIMKLKDLFLLISMMGLLGTLLQLIYPFKSFSQDFFKVAWNKEAFYPAFFTLFFTLFSALSTYFAHFFLNSYFQEKIDDMRRKTYQLVKQVPLDESAQNAPQNLPSS